MITRMINKMSKIQWLITLCTTLAGAIIGSFFNFSQAGTSFILGGVAGFWFGVLSSAIVVSDKVNIPNECARCKNCISYYHAPKYPGSANACLNAYDCFCCENTETKKTGKCPFGSSARLLLQNGDYWIYYKR